MFQICSNSNRLFEIVILLVGSWQIQKEWKFLGRNEWYFAQYFRSTLPHSNSKLFNKTTKVVVSVTRSGDFWKASKTNFHAKVFEIFVKFLAMFKNWYFSSNNYCGYFMGNIGENWATLFLTSGHTSSGLHWIASFHLGALWLKGATGLPDNFPS